MARMPGTQWVGPHHDNGVMSRYDAVCVHTIVGRAPAHAAHFSTNAAGTIFQSRDTAFRSAANLNGNPRVIAIENEDFGPAYGSWSGSNVPPFTAQQCESIANVCAWAHKAHGIPLSLAPNSKSTSRGIAYHRQGCDGNFGSFAYPGRVDGGEVWSTSFGKVCPGDRRISQLINTIIPRARVLAGIDQEVADMTPDEHDWLRQTVTVLGDAYKPDGMSIGQDVQAIRDGQAVLIAKVDAMAGALTNGEANIIKAMRDIVAADADTDLTVTPEQVQQLASALVAALPAGATPQQVQDAVRAAFARAAA